MKFLLAALVLVAARAVAQEGDITDEELSQIFKKPAPADIEPKHPDLQPSGVTPAPGTEGCECVPYYLCKNNSIVTDGVNVIDIRLDADTGPCKNYLLVCCNPPDTTDKPITQPPDINKPKGCGVRNPDGIGFRIKGDKDNEAQFGEFPWMVALLREETVDGSNQKLLIYQCGASLIHPGVVLTSAHCVASKDKQYKVRAGEWDTQTKNELYAHQDRDVKLVIIHPKYHAGSLRNDIALLILDSPLDIVDNVDTVCLPKQGAVVENTRCFASGWGKDVFGKEGKYQVILKKIELPIVQRDACQESLRKTRLGQHFLLHSSFICAGGEEGKDTCKGDGGSPLVCPIPGQRGRYFQAGIVAWGIGCGEDQTPGVYANVAEFSDWIDSQLSAHDIEKSSYTY